MCSAEAEEVGCLRFEAFEIDIFFRQREEKGRMQPEST